MVKLTKICEKCKSVIDSNAIFCPVCRNDVRTYRQRFTSSIIFGVSIILIASIVLIILIKNYLIYFFFILFLFVVAIEIGVSFKK